MNRKPLIVVCGPTASGKTELSLKIAEEFNGEIVSADSMQIYKGLDIATAKPTEDELKRIPHHLISEFDSSKEFSVAEYVRHARDKFSQIYNRGRVPILVGGTGLYISSILDNLDFAGSKTSATVRDKLLNLSKEVGNEGLIEILRKFDPDTAQTLHPNNLNRVIRAIEIYEVTGITLTQHKINSRLIKSPYNSCVIGIKYSDRQKLYDRINERVDKMITDGLIEETKAVFETNDMKTANQAIGYKELVPYFKGEKQLDECISILKMETRRYAKRQLTWFNRIEDIKWILADCYQNKESLFEEAKKIIEFSQII